MSGIVGHMMYAVLGAKAAAQRKLPVAPIVHRHYASYLAGAYLGCDIQTLPESICLDTGKEVGYGTVPVDKSPLTGGPVKPWTLAHGDARFTARDIHALFYGRSHVVFGYSAQQRQYAVPWDHLSDYFSLVVDDALALFGPGQRPLAYVFGWMTHVVGDSLIKNVRPGVDLHLLGGKYTPQNRPIQDLVTFHEVGRKELGLNWEALMADLADTPVEMVQPHFMRVAQRRGRLGQEFSDAWDPQREKLLLEVLAKNRSYFRVLKDRWLDELALTKTAEGWQCDQKLSETTGGLSYAEMVQLAKEANFRHALWQIGEAVADVFEAVVQRQDELGAMPTSDKPDWNELTARWRVPRR